MKTILKTQYYPSVFDNFFGKDWSGVNNPLFHAQNQVPAVNIAENEAGFQIELAAPGFKKEDFKLNLEKNHLTISGQKETNAEATNEKYSRKEFSYGKFSRVFTLPDTVSADQIGATYQDGILVVALPKKEEAKIENRAIEVA